MRMMVTSTMLALATVLAATLAASVLPTSAASAWQQTVVSGTVFTCPIGSRTVTITRSDDRFTYRYGRPGRTEKTIIGSIGGRNLYWRSALFPRGSQRQMRFVDGAYSYVVFTEFRTPNYEGNDAIDRAGIVVLNGARRIARLTCAETMEFLLSDDDAERLIADDDDAHSIFN